MNEHAEYQQIAAIPGLVLGTARFAGSSFERHFHLDFHVGVMSDGVQLTRFNGKSVLHAPGSVALMPPGEIHDGLAVDSNPSTLKTFRFSPELVAGIAEEIGGRHREPELVGALLEDGSLAGHLLRLHDAMRSGARADSLAVQTEWLTVLECLLKQSRAVVPQTVHGALSRMQWERVRDYCFSHLGDKITLDELARLCGLGRFPFLKQFKQTIGMTPHAWLLRLRLERACELLVRGSPAIATVAQEVGFYDQSHFNRAFRQAYGVAPSSFKA